MGFIQVIEFTTTDLAEFDAALSEWTASTSGTRTATRGTLTADRDRPNTYVQIVEFPSYDAAMANSDDPNTTAFAARLHALCEKGPVFRNLDVVSVTDL
jgi:quinol monooxygenase YgiN